MPDDRRPLFPALMAAALAAAPTPAERGQQQAQDGRGEAPRRSDAPRASAATSNPARAPRAR